MEANKRQFKDTKNFAREPQDLAVMYDPKYREFDFVKDKPHLPYLLKKIEKLAGVAYLLSDRFVSDEPLKRLLREEFLTLLKDAHSLKWLTQQGTQIESHIATCISLVAMAKQALFISEMNASVVILELESLLPIVALAYEREREEMSFDPGLFETDAPTARANPKGHKAASDVLYTKGATMPARQDIHFKRQLQEPQQKDSDSTREKMILEIIRTKGDVGIKDITLLVKGVSMKTVQRDLVRLVEKGVLDKVGERRWSRYSIHKA